MISHVYIKNFKLFQSFEMSLNPDLNIIVGDNETGKSIILEATALALTKRLNGKLIGSKSQSSLDKLVDSDGICGGLCSPSANSSRLRSAPFRPGDCPPSCPP
jgi:predicted ATP-binding protein involved in virulence